MISLINSLQASVGAVFDYRTGVPADAKKKN